MSQYFTLEYKGTERSLQGWQVGIDFSISRQSKDKATATLRTLENFDPGITQWAWGEHAIIRAYRESPTGLDDSFSDGYITFQGYFDDPQMESSADSQSITYQLHSIWWLFELNNFKQYVNQFVKFSANLTRVVAASVANGGVGYKANDLITENGGGVGTKAQFQVVAIGAAGTAVLAVPTNGGGSYGASPNVNPAPTTTNGAGAGCTLKLVMGQAPILAPKVLSEIFLGEDLRLEGGYTGLWPNGNGDQIGEVIDWINEIYNPTKRGATIGRDNAQDVVIKGTIDPHTKMCVTRVNSYFASEAILACLRWDPDGVIAEDPETIPPTLGIRKLARWDYTTTPPTFLDYTNLPEVEIDITAEKEREISLKGQQSKLLAGVIIYYKSVNEADGVFAPVIIPDIYPNDGSITDWTPYVSSHTVELQGSKLTHEVALVTTNNDSPFSLMTSGVAGNQAAWWKAHDHTLNDPSIDQASIAVVGAPQIIDDADQPVAAIFKNELTSKLPTWTGERSIRVRVLQAIKFNKKKEAGSAIRDVEASQRTHTFTLVLTTAITQTYQQISSFATAEAIPQNVAESVFRSLSAVQHAGKVEVVSNPIRRDIKIGTRLKLKGPNTTFTNLLVQSIKQIPAHGYSSIEFGPGPAVDIDAWIELARATRTRITWELPSNRGDGGTNPSGSSVNVDTGGATPIANTAHGVGGLSFHSVSAPAA